MCTKDKFQNLSVVTTTGEATQIINEILREQSRFTIKYWHKTINTEGINENVFQALVVCYHKLKCLDVVEKYKYEIESMLNYVEGPAHTVEQCAKLHLLFNHHDISYLDNGLKNCYANNYVNKAQWMTTICPSYSIVLDRDEIISYKINRKSYTFNDLFEELDGQIKNSRQTNIELSRNIRCVDKKCDDVGKLLSDILELQKDCQHLIDEQKEDLRNVRTQMKTCCEDMNRFKNALCMLETGQRKNAAMLRVWLAIGIILIVWVLI